MVERFGSRPGRPAALEVVYDAWGKVTQLSEWSTGWVRGTKDSGTPKQESLQEFSYDALGRRLSENDYHFYYDFSGNVVEEADAAGWKSRYLWAPDGKLILRQRDVLVWVEGLEETIYALDDGCPF